MIFSIGQEFAADDIELGEVIEFSFARKHVEIKHAERLARGGIGDEIKLEIVDPLVGRSDWFKLQSENVLIDGEHAIEHFLEREKDAQRFFIDGEFLFVELVGVIAPIPDINFRRRIFRVVRFHFLQLGNLGGELRLNSGGQVVDVFLGVRAGLGHARFGLIIGPRFVAEPQRDLVAQREHLIEHGHVRVFGQRIVNEVELLRVASLLAFSSTATNCQVTFASTV